MGINVRDHLAQSEAVGYLPEAISFMEMYDFPREIVEAAVRHPDTIEWDPMKETLGYPVVRLRKGDLGLSVSLKHGTPYVMFIHLHHPDEQPSTRASGGVGGGKTPGSMAEVQAWLMRQGCVLTPSGSGVRATWKGMFVTQLHLTPHRGGNTWKSKFSKIRRDLERAKRQYMVDRLKHAG